MFKKFSTWQVGFLLPVNFVKFGQCFWAGETAGLFRFAVSRQYLIGVFFLERFYAFKNAVSKIPFTGQSSEVLLAGGYNPSLCKAIWR